MSYICTTTTITAIPHQTQGRGTHINIYRGIYLTNSWLCRIDSCVLMFTHAFIIFSYQLILMYFPENMKIDCLFIYVCACCFEYVLLYVCIDVEGSTSYSTKFLPRKTVKVKKMYKNKTKIIIILTSIT